MLSTETEIFRRCQASLRLLKEQNKYPTREDIPTIVENVFKEVQNNPIFKKEHFKFIKKEDVIERLQQKITTTISTASILEDKNTGHIEWLQNEDKSNWLFSKRYYEYLSQSPEFDEISADKIFKAADDILSRLEDPKRSGEWRRQGLVFGNVQSGKTTSYSALLNKAVDAGYKRIIVLGGLNNNLRAQTQIALEENFSGAKTASSKDSTSPPIGVGLIDSEKDLKINVVTKRDIKKGDFKKSDFEVIKDIDLGEIPILFVVKKNSSTLGNLLSYFENKIPENKEQIEEPLLIIDDECDHGSINTNDPYQSTNPTKLNSQIRGLLAHFKRCAYIAYTATPFANIFINPEESKLKISLQGGLVKDEQGNVIWEIKGKTRRKKREEIIKAAQDYDLFPRDFIVNLPIADNYIGAKKIFNLPKDLDDDFESNPLPIVITIESLPKFDLKLEKEWIPSPHKKDTIFKYNGNENDISPTLKYSLKNFLLSIAVRNIRIGSNKHNSMLVNITNFNNTQSQIVSNIREEVQHLIEGLKGNFISMVSEFEEIWNNDFVKNTKIMNNLIKSNELNINEPNGFKIHSWDEIRNELVKNVTNKKIEVHPVYGDNRDVLQYDEDYKDVGLNVIAVGAIKLSRGLVIKDLTISYFKRPAKQYDTLLQMGRWFGYRPRYLDVCRLFLDEELLNWFEKSAIGSEKLKDRLDNMINLGKTPRDWGLYVRTFADTKMLIPTARNKMLTSAEYDLNGIEATKPTTTKFDLNSEVIENNLRAFTQLIKLCGNPLKSIDKKIKEQSNSYLFKNINYQPILEFIKQYNSPSMERNLIKSLLIEFIKKSIEKNKIIKWDVFVKGSEEAKNFEKINNYNFSLLQRTPFTGRSAEQELRKGFHYTEEMKENGRKKKNFNDKNILEEKNVRIKNFFHIGNVTDKDLRFLVDDEEYQLAYEKSKEKAKKNNSELPKVASESDIRSSMKSTKAYLCFYLFNPSKSGEDLFNKLYKDKNKTAIGFALHFPGGINLNIKARINKKMQEELGLLDYSDEYYKIEEDE